MTVEERPDLIVVFDDTEDRYGADPLVLRVAHVDGDDPPAVDGISGTRHTACVWALAAMQRGHRRMWVRGRGTPSLSGQLRAGRLSSVLNTSRFGE